MLEQQRRLAQLRYQQRYLERLRQDQLRLQSWRYSDYGPYNYRYSRGGSNYETNRYGAQMLRQAVNNGYEEASAPARPTARMAGASIVRRMPSAMRTRATATTATT